MIDQLIQTIQEVHRDPGSATQLLGWTQKIESFTQDEVVQLVRHFVDNRPTIGELHQALQPVFAAIVSRSQKNPESLSPELLGLTTKLYQATPPASNLRNYLLAWLAIGRHEATMQTWADLLCSDPPQHHTGIGIAFGPLMKRDESPPQWLLDKLLEEGVQHVHVAPAIYDLLNFYVRTEQIEDHPALGSADEMTALLGQLVGQLGKIEDGEIEADADPVVVGRQVADAVSLVVSLCDALALMNHEPAIGKIHQAITLKHRRVQAEAAAALVRLGDDSGKEALVKLADEPIVRLRVLSYAEELGLLDEISLEQRGEIAQAESHLAIWLSEPMQMGVAPTKMTLRDNREMYWPSFEHPLQCYLFEFEYGSGENSYSNLAICGPMVHAFTADLKVLELDDAFALFAGWQTVHDEIFHMAPERGEQAFANEWRKLNDRLSESEEFKAAQVKMLGNFFGKIALVASCQKRGVAGTVIVAEDSSSFIPEGTPTAPITTELAWAMWCGRQLLATFNPTV